MKVVRGYKTELDLTNEQRTACLKHAGASRFAHNWGLIRSKEAYRTSGKRPTAVDLHKELNALKQSEYPWMYEVSKCAPQEALRDLDKAYKNFFRRVELKKQGLWLGKLGYPKPKKRSKAIGSFRLTGSIHVSSDAVQLPRLGRLRLHERDYIPTSAKVLSATVSEQAGRWFVSVQVEEEQEKPAPTATATIGVDPGIKTLATLSDGTIFENPRALKHAQKKLKRLERQKSRRKKGSKNRAKTRQAMSDSNFGEIRRQLEYKSRLYQTHLVVIDRFYPSSKTCSGCGYIKPELSLDERTYVCEDCGLVLDRDLNAAVSLRTVAMSSIATQNAYGERSAGVFNGTRETALVEVGTNQHLGDVLHVQVLENGCTIS